MRAETVYQWASDPEMVAQSNAKTGKKISLLSGKDLKMYVFIYSLVGSDRRGFAILFG